MHFERQNAFQNALNYIFSRKKKQLKKTCVPTLPKIFISVTRNTLIFLFGLNQNCFHFPNRFIKFSLLKNVLLEYQKMF